MLKSESETFPKPRRAARIALLGAALAFAAALSRLGPSGSLAALGAQLLYLPVLAAGLYLGWQAGLAVGILAAAASASWIAAPVYCAAGALAGVFAGRERRKRRVSEETARRLSNVYEELQDNFERMKRAERLYALGQLSAGLAHEIRNPLASIAGSVGVLRRGRSSEAKREECIEIIEKECQRLNRLLTSFLDFARPRALKFQTVEVEAIFDSVLGLAEHAVDGSSITLKRTVSPGMALECDPEQLKQVLLNLVINAIQAMPDGGEIAISAVAQDGEAVIEVRDQGCGVSEDEMEHLYDPFFTTKENGTGLGLPVAHQIVAQSGGVLAARNNPDGGMTFSVRLPMRHGSKA